VDVILLVHTVLAAPAAPTDVPLPPRTELDAELPPEAPTSPLDVLPAEPRPPVTVVQPNPLTDVVPRVRARGMGTAIGLGMLAAVFAAGAAGLRRLNHRLRPTGILPTGVRTIEVLLRLAIVFFGLGAIGALVPASIAPVLPIVVMAGAVAVGWSARDIAQDLIAGVFIAVEGQLRAGYWVSGERYSGSVEALGLRVTWLRDVHGRRIVVPNRVLLAQPLVTDDKPWPRIQFRVRLAVDEPIRDVRKALEEAILLSPWVAPEPEMEVHPDAMDATVWHVAVRVLDSRYAHRFQGLLRERVEEILHP
jgi:small-conductance mechanosensitive channel